MILRNLSTPGNVDRKLAASFGAVVLALTLTSIIVSTILYVQLQRNEEDRLSGALAAIISESISRISFSGKYHARLLVEDMKAKVPVLASISVESGEGSVIAHSDPAQNDTIVTGERLKLSRKCIVTNSIVVSEYEHNGSTVKEIILPYRSGLDAQIAGVVRMGVNVQKARSDQRNNFIKLIILILSLTSAAIWAVFILSRRFGGSVRTIAEQLQAILDNSPALIYMKDKEGRYIFINRLWTELFHTTNDMIKGKTDLELFPKEIAEKFIESDRLVFSSGMIHESEELAPIDGEIRSYHSIKVALKDRDDTVYALCGISTDITERKRAEEALINRETILRAIVEGSTDAIFVKDYEGRYILINESGAKFFNRKPSQIIGFNDRELLGEEAGRYLNEQDEIIKAGGSARTAEENFVIGGVLRTFLAAKAPYMNSKNEIIGLIGISRDITERKQIEDRIKSERERLLVTLRSIGDAVITTDVEGNIVLMNRIAEILTGWQSPEAEGKPLTDVFNIIDENTRMKNENPVNKVIRMGSIIELPQHTILVSRDGSERLIADSGAPIRDSESNIIGIVLVFRDITEKKKTETLLLNSQKLESLGVLAGGIAHDFNNLLGGLFGYLELLRMHISRQDTDRMNDTLNKIMQVFDRTKALTRQLLTFAKGGEPVKRPLLLASLITSTAQFVLSGTKIECDYDIQHDLMPCIADENQIGQVLDNIIINAIQFMPDGGRIKIKADNFLNETHNPKPYLQPGQYVRIAITDQGPGIPKSSLTRIFDPFYTTKKSGTGLGLATCFSIMKKHGGAIEADSVNGEGSTFTLYLPTTEIDEIPGPGTEAEILSDFKGKILIMDDEDFMRNTSGEYLKALGIRVDTAATGEEALSKYKSAYTSDEPFDLVILDLTVKGGLGGRETMEILKQINPAVKAIASSGYSSDPIMADPLKYGFQACLVKPYRLEELNELLKKLT